jgi:hypothetical protein
MYTPLGTTSKYLGITKVAYTEPRRGASIQQSILKLQIAVAYLLDTTKSHPNSSTI